MNAHPTEAPTRSSHDTPVRLATETAVIRPADRASAEPPPALALCWHCSAVADTVTPPGWVTANPADDLGLRYTYGVCPTCLAAVYTFPTSTD